MSDEVKPRIWVGKAVSHTLWKNRGMGWFVSGRHIIFGDIFVPGSEPKPTIDPSKMKMIETCDKVDWSNE